MSTYIYNSLRAPWIIYPCSLGTWGSRGAVVRMISNRVASSPTWYLPYPLHSLFILSRVVFIVLLPPAQPSFLLPSFYQKWQEVVRVREYSQLWTNPHFGNFLFQWLIRLSTLVTRVYVLRGLPPCYCALTSWPCSGPSQCSSSATWWCNSLPSARTVML